MCGRYVSPDEAAIERYWQLGHHDGGLRLRQSFNVAPTSSVPIIRRAADGGIELAAARWGLVPWWWKKTTLPSLTFNARSEEAAGKPMWRQSLRSMRCLMPARGWYEWNENEPVRTLAGRAVNQPYYLFCPTDPVIAFAGLWSCWEPPGGSALMSCALLSREAAAAVAAVHHRMPVVLPAQAFAAWLDPNTPQADIAALVAAARDDFECYAVSTRVNSTRNDGAELLDRLSAGNDNH